MKNDVVFQFFQQKQKMALFPANAAIVTTLSNYNSSKLNSTPPPPPNFGEGVMPCIIAYLIVYLPENQKLNFFLVK